MSVLWAGYVRVSDKRGRGGDSYRSVIDQREAIQRWVAARGELVEVFPEEENESGGRADRPILMEAVEGVESGRYVGIVAAYQSRIMRDNTHLGLFRRRIEKAGGVIAVADAGILGTDAKSNLMIGVTGAFDQYVKEEHSERFKALGASAVGRGVYPMPVEPFGYSKHPETRRLTPNVDAPKVVQAYNDRIAGESAAKIAAGLGRSEGAVRNMLKNRVYLGELRKGAAVNAEAHPPIVSEDVFDAVQGLRGKRPARAKGAEPGLLIGLIRCQGCGHMMRRCQRGRSSGYVYECRRNHATGSCPAPASITAKRVEDFVSVIARNALETIRLQSTDRADDTLAIRSQIAGAERELREYLSAVSAADIGAEAFRVAAKEREGKVAAARSQLEARMAIRTVAPNIEHGAAAWDGLSIEDRNTVLRGLIEFVAVRRVGQGRTVPVGERVRVFAKGAIDTPSKRRSPGHPIVTIEFPDRGDERVLWMPDVENGFESAGG